MKIKESDTRLFHSPAEAILSVCGLLVLAVLLLRWWFVDNTANIAGHVAALVSVALFAWIGLQVSKSLTLSFEESGRERLWHPASEGTLNEGLLFGLSFLFGCLLLLAVAVVRAAMAGELALGRLSDYFQMSDSGRYDEIITHWYRPTPGVEDFRIVFFPLYPLLARLLSALTGELPCTAVLLNITLYAVSNVLLYRLLLLDSPEYAARGALWFRFLLPGTFFFVGPLSESAFFFATLCCIYLARKKAWLGAGLFGALSAYARSLGLLTLVPLLIEALTELRFTRRKGWRRFVPLLCCGLVPLGLAAFLITNYRHYGDPLFFLAEEDRVWGQRMGVFFASTASQVDQMLYCLHTDYPYVSYGLWGPNVIASLGCLLLYARYAGKVRPSCGVWFLAYYFVAISPTYLLSAPRYLLAMVGLYPALAELCRSKRARNAALLLSALLSLGYLYAFCRGWEVY